MWHLPPLLWVANLVQYQSLVFSKFEQISANVVFATLLLYFGYPRKSIFSSSVKYFGVYLSDDLHWKEHIKIISNKANKTFGFLKRNLTNCPHRTKKTAYKALVRPTLEYCSTVWDQFATKKTNKAEMIQRRAVGWDRNPFNSKMEDTRKQANHSTPIHTV